MKKRKIKLNILIHKTINLLLICLFVWVYFEHVEIIQEHQRKEKTQSITTENKQNRIILILINNVFKKEKHEPM